MQVRLHPIKALMTGKCKYVALSYYWGGKQAYVTTKANLLKRMQ